MAGAMLARLAMRLAVLLGTGAAAADQPAAQQPAKPFLDPLFTAHAVFQRDKPVTVWGWAKPRTGVAVTFDKAVQKTRTDRAGRWAVTLPPHAAGGPFTLYATGSNGTDVSVGDIMVGDVWLCSGQSNMEFPLHQVTWGEAPVRAATDRDIRLFTVPKASLEAPSDQFAKPTSWQLTTPDTARDFSAACFFMGREVAKATGVTVGLIHSSWGGSSAQAWIPEDGLKSIGDYNEALGALRLHARAPARAEEAFRLQMDSWWTEKAGDNEPGKPDFDDSIWPITDAKQIWESWGIPELEQFDGVMWYRTTLDLSEDQARGAAMLTMGAVDDLDETLVNGERVGGMRGWNAERSYRVRTGLLKPGRNVIAVRVLDINGGGGLYGDPAARVLTFADGSQLPVAGPWRWQKGPALTEIGDAPTTPWDDIHGLTKLYNGMIAPLVPYALKGFAWYQGESNAGDPKAYAKLLPGLIAAWRERFDARPFLVVQLAGYGARRSEPYEGGWAKIREVQRRVVAADGETAMATAIDIGDPDDIHPVDKPELGRRLGIAARAAGYGEKIAGSGPVPISASQTGGAGAVRITFDVRDGALKVIGGNRPVGFELCDAAGRCRFADAAVEGATVTIAAETAAAKIRYLWADSPVVNLYDARNLPVPPFELAVIQLPARGDPQPAAPNGKAE